MQQRTPQRRRMNTSWTIAVGLGMAASGAFGQSLYRCNAGAGTYLSDRPCASAPPAVLKSYGPVREVPVSSQGYTPSMAKAPDILSYMSVECAEMNDAVRTGPTRGLKGAAMSELHTNYRSKCAEDEQIAHRKLSEKRADERQQKQTAQAAQKTELAQARMTVEQCSEMLRILAGKRQRTATMTPGERSDMELFEANYRARCKG